VSRRWAVILAGGDGVRLRSMTRGITGDERPKQFCALVTEDTLLTETRRRVAQTVPAHRTLVVVNRAHERFYVPLLADMAAPRGGGAAREPRHRGRDPARAAGAGQPSGRGRHGGVLPVGPLRIRRPELALEQLRDGGPHAHAARARPARRARPPSLVRGGGERPGTVGEATALERLYCGLPSVDFSRHVLGVRPDRLAVLPVRRVHWDDLGEPERVLATRRRARSVTMRPTVPVAIPA
jgi:hypothetical protein